MGTIGLKIKLMPTSPDADLEKIKTDAIKVIESKEGKNITFEEEPVAFGLKAVIATFALDEDSGDSDGIENGLSEMENISSSKIIDMRRAFG